MMELQPTPKVRLAGMMQHNACFSGGFESYYAMHQCFAHTIYVVGLLQSRTSMLSIHWTWQWFGLNASPSVALQQQPL
jgi:diphthamide synthase (EF-2-diphthine--ammonia ligase)